MNEPDFTKIFQGVEGVGAELIKNSITYMKGGNIIFEWSPTNQDNVFPPMLNFKKDGILIKSYVSSKDPGWKFKLPTGAEARWIFPNGESVDFSGSGWKSCITDKDIGSDDHSLGLLYIYTKIDQFELRQI